MIKKLIIICILAFAGGFANAFFKHRGIDLTIYIYLVVGYLSGLIINS
jgi:hypothetical protein|nr:MAG TPA: hypothetical protein [Caudoviricetes sp.]